MSDIISNKFITNLAFKNIDFNNDVYRCILCIGNFDEDFLTDVKKYEDVAPFELDQGNGYTTGGVVVDTSVHFDLEDKVTVYDCENPSWIATGGDIGPVRYAVLYNETFDNTIVYIFDFEEQRKAINGAKFEINIHPNGLMRAKQKI
ncbi:MAG: hypothetical protein WC260_01805 [Candidatus Pacearchaeota archaeon]